MNLSPSLIQAYLQIIREGRTMIVAPVSQPNSKKEAHEQTESRIDFEFEQIQNVKMWNDPAHGAGASPGDLFAFVHLSDQVGGDDGLLEVYWIKEVLPPTEGRAHWYAEDRKGKHFNRAVLVLGDKIGEMTFTDHKEIHGYKQTYARLAGTKRCNRIADGIAEKLQAMLPVDLQSNAAKLWTHQPEHETLFTCKKVVRELTELSPGYKLYDNSVYAAARTMDMLLSPESGGYGITIAELQSGKSGTALLIATAFRRMLEIKHGFTGNLAVVFVTHISDTNIKAQSERDHFQKAGFESSLFSSSSGDELYRNPIDDKVFLHIDMLSGGAFRDGKENARGRLTNAVQKFKLAGCDRMLVISDEVQVATDLDQQFERWLTSEGFSIKSKTESPNLFMIGVTATATKFYTPFSDGNPLYVCYNPPADVYYGLKDMLETNRIVDIGDGIRDDLHAEQLLREHDVLDKGGKYILVRTTAGKIGDTKQEEVWKTVAKRNNIEVRNIDSSERNISSLNKQLAFKRNENEPPMMLLIKGALQAGITLRTVENICGAIDAYSSQDAVVQSIPGRMCGNIKDRSDATFPIFTRKKTIEKYVEEMRLLANNILPNSLDAVRDEADMKWVQASAPHCGTVDDFRKARVAQFGEKAEIGTNTIYGHSKKDFADIILNDAWPDHSLRAIALGNHIENFDYRKSVTKLLAKYPQLSEPGSVLWVDVEQSAKGKKRALPTTAVNASKDAVKHRTSLKKPRKKTVTSS